MTRNEAIAKTIYNQIGGRRFTVMTGAKDFITIDNGLRFKIGRNGSKANMVEIKLNGSDLYDMEFIKFSPVHLSINHRKGTADWKDEVRQTIRKFDDIYFDQLQELFTEATGLYTHF